MRSLEQDVPRTISRVLSTHDWQGRKELIDKVFKEDAKFWHLFFQTVNRKELFGVYQMWGKRAATKHRSLFRLGAGFPLPELLPAQPVRGMLCNVSYMTQAPTTSR